MYKENLKKIIFAIIAIVCISYFGFHALKEKPQEEIKAGATISALETDDTGAESLIKLNSSISNLNNDKIEHSDVSGGAGINYNSGVITLDPTGDWTGTFDGQQGSYYLDSSNHTGVSSSSATTSAVVCISPDTCEYQGDGTADGVQIKAAIDSGSKSIYLKEGRYDIVSEIASTRNDIHIRGAGASSTILVASTAGLKIFNIGTGSGPNIQENFSIRDLTLDLNGVGDWGIAISWVDYVTVERIHVRNFHTSSMAGMFIGAFSNQELANFRFGNIKVKDNVFDGGGVVWNWEMVTIGYADKAEIVGNVFKDKTGTSYPGFLFYNVENSILQNNIFDNASMITGGKGPVSITSNTFKDSRALVWMGNNHTFSSNQFFRASSTSSGGVGISSQGLYLVPGGSETPYYITATTSWENENLIINGNNFSGCNSYCLASTIATDGAEDTLSTRNAIITNNTFASSTWSSMNFIARDLIVANNQFNEGNRGGVPSATEAIVGGENVLFTGNIFRDQDDVVTGDLLINRDEYVDHIASTYIAVKDNLFCNSAPIRYYSTSSGLILGTTTGITVDIEGNKGYADIEG